MVDQSLLRLFNDSLPEIGPFFFGQTRTGAFSTEATNTFRYAPATTAVASALVEERERLAAQSADDFGRTMVVEQLADLSAANAMLPHAVMPPAAPDVAAIADGEAEAKSQPLIVGVQGGGMENFPAGRRACRAQSGNRANESRDKKEMAGEDFGEATEKAKKSAERAQGGRGTYLALNTRLRNGFVAADEFGFDGVAANDPQSRQRFLETAYWNPRVVTGKDGKARVSFKAPLGPFGIPDHGPRCHRCRHAGGPDRRDFDGEQELFRRLEGPGVAHAG